MKKSIFTFILALVSICAISQNLLTFQINTVVLSSDGTDIKTGVVCKFLPRNAFISLEDISCDINWWTSIGAKTKGEATIWACTDPNNRMATRITNVAIPIQSPKQICYNTISDWLLEYLEGIYGEGNVTVVQ